MAGGEGSDDVRRGDRADQPLLPCSTPRMICVGESVEWLQENEILYGSILYHCRVLLVT